MKEKPKTNKVVVIGLQKRVEDSFINSVEQYFGKDFDTFVKSVFIEDLDQEFEYQPAQQIICMPAVGHRLEEIMQRWKNRYPTSTTKFLILGRIGEGTDFIEYAEDITAWKKKKIKGEKIKKTLL